MKRRARGCGSIISENGKFRFRIRLNGSQRYFNLAAHSPREAAEEADKILKQYGILSEIRTKEE